MNDQQLLRYSRQIMLPKFDVAGQERLLKSRVLIVGLGGLGCPVAMYLAAAGVGTLVLADFDEVDLTNLQRQIAHGQADVGQPKVLSAQQTLRQLNDTIEIEALNQRLDDDALAEKIAQVDAVVDCTDNVTTRQAINRACVASSTPLISGAAIGFEGQVAVYDSTQEDAPCYHCLYAMESDDNLTCSESGVISPLVGIVGAIQALEAIKVLAKVGQPLVGKLMIFDALYSEWRTLSLPRDPACSVCSETAPAKK
ncbi:MAG: molybdopterin-synthase adenylyltransferase MoeB [Cellvibrionaceae bacterium]